MAPFTPHEDETGICLAGFPYSQSLVLFHPFSPYYKMEWHSLGVNGILVRITGVSFP
jgi:hypothetical protein